ncbi:MAG: Maf family protein [bacterium]|nr:Maf family protein [bacterium]
MTIPASISTAFWERAGITRPIILASSSPRRAAILRSLGCPFEVVPPDFDEGEYGPWDGGELLRRRSVEKASAIRLKRPGRAVLSADTIVVLNQQVFGKPADAAQATLMLKRLSEKEHQVWSAICFLPMDSSVPRIKLCSTRVMFHALGEAEISAYVDTGEPLDKAGAYGIQEIGGLWVSRIEGCYFNVVGLPVSQLWDLLISQ